MMTPTQTCSHCGCTAEGLTEFEGQPLCLDCLEDLTTVCVDCGGRFWRRNCCGNDEGAPVCYDCFRNNYTHCTRCGQTISNDDCWYPLDNDDPYCRDCFDAIENAPIHDYYFKPRPTFYGDGPRHFGVELEIDGAGEDDSNASALLRIANQEYPLAYAAAQEYGDLSLMLMLETGLSRSELLGLRWEDIDEENRCLRVTQGLVVYHDVEVDRQVMCSDGLKNKFRKRTLPITDDTLWLRLTQTPQTVKMGGKEIRTEYIIHSPEGKPYNPNNWANRVFRPFMQRLHREHPDIPELSPHELRHTRATLWIAQGIDPYMVARLLGHSDLKMLTKIYDHTSTETLRKALLGARPAAEAKKGES